MISLIKKWLGLPVQPPLDKAYIEKGTVIDVRTPAEFASGHVPGSQNIPLDKLAQSQDRISKLRQPIITCCASGMRSGAGAKILHQQGIEARNGGSWQKVNRLLQQ